MNKTNYSKTLKIGVFLDQLAYPIDPSNNPNITNAFFSNNLYSNLIDVDENNNYQNELVSKYWFDNEHNKLYLEFEESRVTAKDAEFSLRRLIVQNKQLHADFWNIICEVNESSLKCMERIYVEGQTLVIKYSDADKAQYILPTLASVDYKIIPKAAFDTKDYEKATIVDYKITSGYYHLEVRDHKNFFVKNENVRDDIFLEYELINMNADSLIGDKSDLLLSHIDIISTTVVIQREVYEKLARRNWNIFKSHNISIYLLAFSRNIMQKTTASERFNYAGRMNNEAGKLVTLANAEKTIEFFQDYGQGFLNTSQKNDIIQLRSQESSLIDKKITYGTKFPDKWSTFTKNNPDILITKNDQFPINMKTEEQPDMFIISNDASFDLSLSLISYAANVGLLDMTKAEVDEFANLKNEDEKISFINKVHFKTLKECKIYPMWSSPYHTAFNGHYEHNLSKFNSRTLLWKIH